MKCGSVKNEVERHGTRDGNTQRDPRVKSGYERGCPSPAGKSDHAVVLIFREIGLQIVETDHRRLQEEFHRAAGCGKGKQLIMSPAGNGRLAVLYGHAGHI